jgi:hypothetical protein
MPPILWIEHVDQAIITRGNVRRDEDRANI